MDRFSGHFTASARLATFVIGSTSICFGLVPLFARILTDAGLSPEAIALYRFGLTLPLALYFLPRARAKRRPALILTAGGLLMGLGWTTYLHSLDHLSVANAGLVYMSYPLFVVIIAGLVFRQPLGVRAVVSAIMVLAAATLAFEPTGLASADTRHLLACLPAPVSFGLIVVLIASVGHQLTVLERWGCIAVGAVLGLLPLSIALDPQGLIPAQSQAWLWIGAMTLVTAAIPQIVYTYVAPRVGATRAAAAGALELPTMFAIGWLAFAENITPAQMCAAALVAGAIVAAPVVRSWPQRVAESQAPLAGLRTS